MAVDEACATLVPLAAPGAMLTCQFIVASGLIEFVATVPVARPSQVPQNTFGWRVLATLTDEVQAISHESSNDAGDSQQPMVGIRLCLCRERDAG